MDDDDDDDAVIVTMVVRKRGRSKRQERHCTTMNSNCLIMKYEEKAPIP